MIKFLESLLEDVDCIRKMIGELSIFNKDIIHIISRLNNLYGKIEGAKTALEWTQKEKK